MHQNTCFSIFHQNASINVAQYEALREVHMTEIQDLVTAAEVQLKKQWPSKEETQISKNGNNLSALSLFRKMNVNNILEFHFVVLDNFISLSIKIPKIRINISQLLHL